MQWSDYFYYDDTSPTFLRWKIEVRTGRAYNITLVSPNDVAGSYPENPRTYSRIWINGDAYMLHRVVWELHKGKIPEGLIVDHIDGDTRNNNISNLALKTPAQNGRNVKKTARNNSGVVGVYFGSAPKNLVIAKCSDINGNRIVKTFSINKYGIMVAFKMAVEYRNKTIEALNNQGAGYTERHGK